MQIKIIQLFLFFLSNPDKTKKILGYFFHKFKEIIISKLISV